jgi:sec-independent protein translocase protein TatC
MDQEDGLLRMSFLEHLQELRSRLIRALLGFGVIFLACLAFSDKLWLIVQAPAVEAFRKLGTGGLVGINAMEQFEIIWMWTPLVASLFLGSPWILYQVWAFIAPGLYERERKWAIPFVLTTAGLFILGGLFAYFRPSATDSHSCWALANSLASPRLSRSTATSICSSM